MKKKIINPKPYSSHQPSFDGPAWFGPLINTVSKIYPIILTECFIGADSEINFLLLSHVWQDYVLKAQSNIFINAHVLEVAFILKLYREDLIENALRHRCVQRSQIHTDLWPQSSVHPAGSLHLSGAQTGNKMNVILHSHWIDNVSFSHPMPRRQALPPSNVTHACSRSHSHRNSNPLPPPHRLAFI